jgi:anti-anti-sigma factor
MTLRISIHERPEATVLEIEGRVAGPWADELDRVWQSVAASLGSKKLLVDLTGITHMDAEGIRILADIHKRTGAEFMADSPMTKYFADQARRNKKDTEEEE